MANQNGFIKLSKRRGLLFNKNMSNTHYVPTVESCSQRAEPFHFTVTFIFTSDVTHRRIPQTSLLLMLGVWHIIPFFPGVNYAVHRYSWALLVLPILLYFKDSFNNLHSCRSHFISPSSSSSSFNPQPFLINLICMIPYVIILIYFYKILKSLPLW